MGSMNKNNKKEKIMERLEKVFWENETTYKLYVNDKILPYGIYYYDGEEIMHVDWYKTEKERDKVYESEAK